MAAPPQTATHGPMPPAGSPTVVLSGGGGGGGGGGYPNHPPMQLHSAASAQPHAAATHSFGPVAEVKQEAGRENGKPTAAKAPKAAGVPRTRRRRYVQPFPLAGLPSVFRRCPSPSLLPFLALAVLVTLTTPLSRPPSPTHSFARRLSGPLTHRPPIRDDRKQLAIMYGELYKRMPAEPTAESLATEFADKEIRVLMSQNGMLINDLDPNTGR